MSETKKAWLAGLIDGDGSFFVTDRGGLNPCLHISVSMRHKSTCLHCFNITGVGGFHASHMTSTGNQMWKWAVGNWGQVAQLCEALLPYLVTKHRQAKIMLEIAKTRVWSWDEYNTIAQDRERLYACLKELNFSK